MRSAVGTSRSVDPQRNTRYGSIQASPAPAPLESGTFGDDNQENDPLLRLGDKPDLCEWWNTSFIIIANMLGTGKKTK